MRGEQDLHGASAMSHFSTTGKASLDENAWMVPSKCAMHKAVKEGKKRQVKLSLPVLLGEQKTSFIFSMENMLHN